MSVELRRDGPLGTAAEPVAKDLRRSAVAKRRATAVRLVEFIARADSPGAVAARGAAVFREAVLLVRSTAPTRRVSYRPDRRRRSLGAAGYRAAWHIRRGTMPAMTSLELENTPAHRGDG